MVFSIQSGSVFKIKMRSGSLLTGSFTYSSFPFAKEEWVEQSFRTNLEGFLSGRFRIREGWFWTYLEAPGPDGWVTESRYTGGYHRRRRGHITVNIPRAGLVDG